MATTVGGILWAFVEAILFGLGPGFRVQPTWLVLHSMVQRQLIKGLRAAVLLLILSFLYLACVVITTLLITFRIPLEYMVLRFLRFDFILWFTLFCMHTIKCSATLSCAIRNDFQDHTFVGYIYIIYSSLGCLHILMCICMFLGTGLLDDLFQ
jgi:hypothetical protein